MQKTWLVLILAGALHAADTSRSAARQEGDKLQGVWVGTEEDTKDASKKAVRVEIKAGKLTITAKDRTASVAAYKIDAGKKPATMDLTFDDGGKSAEVLAIFELKGDNLKLCLSATIAGPRPKAFKATEDTILITLKRQKAGK
jgi:uncharacterized protein (TIGR03067 family)